MAQRRKTPPASKTERRMDDHPAKRAAAERAANDAARADEEHNIDAPRAQEPPKEEANEELSKEESRLENRSNAPEPNPVEVKPPEAWDAGARKADRVRSAVFRPDPGVDIEDPQYRKELRAYLDEMDKLSAQKAAPQPGQDQHPPVVDGVPHVTVVQPETTDQQTQQIPWIPNAPGNMVKVRAVATDPSVVQIPRPAPGEPPVSNEDQSAILDQFPGLRQIIADAIKAAKAADAEPTANTMAEYLPHPSGEPFRPPDVLAHYRNDAEPEQRIIRMTVPEGDDPNEKMIYDHDSRGHWMQFHGGHFFATEPWQKAQLDWMANHPQNHPLRPSEVLGGDPHLYEHVDDAPVYWCPTPGCEFVSGSAKALAAHRKATHGG